MERLKSALHLSITTVQQHIASKDPYSPAALLADQATAMSLATNSDGSGAGGSPRHSNSGKGDGGDGGGALCALLDGANKGVADRFATSLPPPAAANTVPVDETYPDVDAA